MTSYCVCGGIFAGLFLRPAIEYAGTLCSTHYPGFPSSATTGGGAVLSHAHYGSSAASTDDASASSSQDATGQEAKVIEVETEEGGASNMAKTVLVVEPAKIFDVRAGAEFAVRQPVIDAIEPCKVVLGRVLYPSTRGYIPGYLPCPSRR